MAKNKAAEFAAAAAAAAAATLAPPPQKIKPSKVFPEAFAELGFEASDEDVLEWILAKYPNYDKKSDQNFYQNCRKFRNQNSASPKRKKGKPTLAEMILLAKEFEIKKIKIGELSASLQNIRMLAEESGGLERFALMLETIEKIGVDTLIGIEKLKDSGIKI